MTEGTEVPGDRLHDLMRDGEPEPRSLRSPVRGDGCAEDAVGEKDRIVAKAEGNPLAVGLIAFGAGLLLASLIPASSKEKDLASTVKEQAQPLVNEVTEVAKQVGEHLEEPAQEAVAAVKISAQESAATVKDEAQSATSDVTDQAQQAREHVVEN